MTLYENVTGLEALSDQRLEIRKDLPLYLLNYLNWLELLVFNL